MVSTCPLTTDNHELTTARAGPKRPHGWPDPRTGPQEELLIAAMQVLEQRVQRGEVPVPRRCWTCHNYRGDRAKRHHCLLPGRDLTITELRTDRPEHERAA